MNSNQQFGLSLLSVAVITLWFCTSRQSLFKYVKTLFNRKRLSENEVIKILDQLALANMEILTELTHMVCGIRKSLRSRGLDTTFHSQELEAALMEQSFETRFKEAQANVFKKFDVSEDDVAESCKQMLSIASVKTRVDGLSQMFYDALNSTLPVLSCVELPHKLKSPENVLEIFELCKKKRLERLQDALINVKPELLTETGDPNSTRFPPSAELNEMLKKVVVEAETSFIEDLLGFPDSLMLYRHAVATHSRYNEKFLAAKTDLDTIYAGKTVDSIQSAIYFATNSNKQELTAKSLTACPYFSANDLSKCITETKDTKVVCQILPSLDTTDQQKLIQNKETNEFAETVKAEAAKLPPLAVSFYCTTVDEFNAALSYEKSIRAEPIAGGDHPVYAVFLNSELTNLCHDIPNLFEKLHATPGRTKQTELL